MNETIGQKAGHNDLRRTMIITKKQKEKLKKQHEEEELRELEKEVRKQQILTFATSVPLVTAGVVFKTLTGQAHIEATSPLILPTSSTENNKKTSFLTTDKHNNIIEVEIKTSPSSKEKVQVNPSTIEKIISREKVTSKKNTPIEVIKVKQDSIPIKETFNNKEELRKAKDKEIISHYEEKLKAARIELKEIVYEYRAIEETYQNIYNSKEMQELLDRLNLIINKLEELKEKIILDKDFNYDENYIKDLVKTYIDSFDKQEVINEIKDSPLYILISSKIEELEIRKELLSLSLEDRKDTLKIDENSMEDIKSKYDRLQNFDENLAKIQKEQEALIRDFQEKISSSVTARERVEVTTRILNNQARNLMGLLALQTLIPGTRSATRIALATSGYLNLMRNIIRPRREVHHYIAYDIEDYSNAIENSIKSLEDSLDTIKKTSKELKSMISDFKTDYNDYLHQKEVEELLSNLENVYNSLKEKEEELIKMKEEQEKNLVANNNKVKVYSRYETID